MTSNVSSRSERIPDYPENVQRGEYLILDYRDVGVARGEDVISRYKRSEPQFYPDFPF